MFSFSPKLVMKRFKNESGWYELSLMCGTFPQKPVEECDNNEIWYCLNGVRVEPHEFAQFYNFESPFASFGKLGYDRYRKAGR